MNATQLAGLLTDMLRLSTSAHGVTVDGCQYVVTLDTGERSYGSEGGRLAYAYDASDVEAYIERHEPSGTGTDYSADFCHACTPDIDRDLAISLAAREEWRLTHGTDPVLSDEEYWLARAAVLAAARG